MNTERDIIIERLEQRLAARDKQMEEMKDELRESVIEEIEKRFSDKIRLRESTLDDIRTKFGEKVNEIIEMNKSLRDSILDEQRAGADKMNDMLNRVNRLERKITELNSAYDGVMKELLDQKSRIRDFTSKKIEKAEPEIKPEVKASETELSAKQKGEYIVADSYAPKDRKKQQQTIEARETPAEDEKPVVEKPPDRPEIKKTEKVREGVEIIETLRKR